MLAVKNIHTDGVPTVILMLGAQLKKVTVLARLEVLGYYKLRFSHFIRLFNR